MSLDPAPIAKLAAEFMDELEQRFPDAELVTYGIVAQLDLPGGEEDVVRISVENVDDRLGSTEVAGLMARATAAALSDD